MVERIIININYRNVSQQHPTIELKISSMRTDRKVDITNKS